MNVQLYRDQCRAIVHGLCAAGLLFWVSSSDVRAQAPAAPEPQASGQSAGLQARVQQLEEQLVDLQVVIGTLESIARSGGGGAAAGPVTPDGGFAAGGVGSVDAARMSGMETQIRAMTAQIEQLSQQVRAMSAGGDGGGLGPRGAVSPRAPLPGVAPAPGGTTEPAPRDYAAGGDPAAPADGGFGATTVTPSAAGDPIGGLLSSDGWQSSQQVAAAEPSGGDPKALYETAYGYLLQQNYGAAETAFGDFLNRHPNDQLAGNAQYWLGESYYVRGQYKAAASAFLKGYETYKASPKAPDSLLKLAMSLDKLGQRDAACSSFAELTSRFPQAPAHVKNRASSERNRAGC